MSEMDRYIELMNHPGASAEYKQAILNAINHRFLKKTPVQSPAQSPAQSRIRVPIAQSRIYKPKSRAHIKRPRNISVKKKSMKQLAQQGIQRITKAYQDSFNKKLTAYRLEPNQIEYGPQTKFQYMLNNKKNP